MSELFSQKKLHFITGAIGSIALILGGAKASAFSGTFAIIPEKATVELRDDSGAIVQSSGLTKDPVEKFKVYIPETQDHSPQIPTWESQPLEIENQPQELVPQETLDPEILLFHRVMQYAFDAQLTDRPFGEIMQAIAEQFLGTPYVGGLLDKSNQETLVVTLKGFDCVLFIESVLAIARGVAVQDYAYEGFRDRIQEQRYRDGQLNGYCSRLHYFSDWIDDNQNRQIVHNITDKLGGIPLNTTLNFMTENRQYYPQLANESDYQCIRDQESQLANLNIHYIPQDQIATIYPNLQPGDIIATATDIPGLDVTHTGLVYRLPDGNIGFIHASPSGEVTISRDLQSYVQAVDGQIGIIIARP